MNSGDEDLEAKLRAFEAVADPSDPEQLKLLEEMREHMRRLRQARGDWNKPNNFRNWNDPTPRPDAVRDPLSIETFKEYKKHVEREQKPALLLAQGAEQKLLQAPSPPSPPHSSAHTAS